MLQQAKRAALAGAAVLICAGWMQQPVSRVEAQSSSPAVSAVHQHQEPTNAPASSGAIYYCPMHPNYKSDKPGDCPICGMNLVPLREQNGSASAVAGHSVINLSHQKRQMIGLRLGKVGKQHLVRSIRTAGIVDYNEQTLSAVNLKLNGWVEELAVKAEGGKVKKGMPLLYLYSPELLEAQKSYLVALHARSSLPHGIGKDGSAFADQTLKSARERLLLWDMSPEQLKDLEGRKDPAARTPILSRVDGTVVKRKVVEGSYVQAGSDLYEIADLSTVWVYGDFYPADAPLLKPGQEARISPASVPNQSFTAAVAHVYPYMERETRTVRVRFELPNPEARFRPGDYAVISLEVPLGWHLVVDDEAIMDSGEKQLVFVAVGDGEIEPRQVKVGARTGGTAAIIEGLKEGEQVITSGTFLVDAESKLKAALMEGGSAGHDH